MASAYDKASLVMLPHAYKDDKLYSVKPEDRSGDFTFSRDGAGASPATRVNASGLIEKGRTNELLQSNSFNNWISNNTSETIGQTGYDGTNDAWLLSKSAASAYMYVNNSVSGVQTFSIYAKSGSLSWMRIVILGASDFIDAFFNLADGSLGINSGLISASSENIGVGWYRYSLVLNGSPSQVRIYPADLNGNVSGTSGNILIQDAQREQGLVATDYIETTTAPVSAGLLGDMPRLDYSGGATCPSLLLEPSRTNVLSHSEYIDSYYTFNDSTITDNAATSPEGVQNASKLVEGSASSHHNYQRTLPVSDGNYSFSVFAKAAERNFLIINAYGNASYRTWFNLSTGEVGTSATGNNPKIEDYGNGWYRCSVSRSLSGTKIFQVAVSSADNVGSYQGDGTSGIYTYGCQAESGSYSTSYIPTYGSASGRAVDDARKTSIGSLLNNTEGTLFAEYTQTQPITSVIFQVSVGNNSDRVQIENQGGGAPLMVVTSGGSTQAVVINPTTIPIGERRKVAVTYKQNEFKLFVNGVLAGTDTSGNVPTSLTAAYIASEAGTSYAGFKTNQTLYFKTALTEAECIALTTI